MKIDPRSDRSKLILDAIAGSFKKLDLRSQWQNPVMFVTELGAIFTTLACVLDVLSGHFSSFNLQITLWLWFTVLFANFAESLAEGRGKAQAESLRKGRVEAKARLIAVVNGVKSENLIPVSQLRKGDTVICEVNDLIPADGEVIEGIASVDESAITGESAPVIRESGGDRSAVTGGTRVISDRILIQVSCDPGNTYVDRMIALIENASRQKTPNEIALSLVLSALTLVLLLAIITLKFFTDFSAHEAHQDLSALVTIPILTALVVCLIPTTIGGLLSAIGIAGMDRLFSQNVLAKSGRAVEAAGDIDVLLLDKTGTITFGNRMATEFIPAPGVMMENLVEAIFLSSQGDETPEGRSILNLIDKKIESYEKEKDQIEIIPFSAYTRMSGVNFSGRSIRKGATESIRDWVKEKGGHFPKEMEKDIDRITHSGGTPLVLAENQHILGVIHLKDVVKPLIKERFAQLRKMGIRTVMVTGDNPATAAAIALEAGVDDFMAQATPEMKLKRIREEQSKGHLVAMTGDGTNDAPALAQADVGVAMSSGTQAAREAGNMVDMDSNPTKLIQIVEIGKQLLMTRGSLTTFSISNDVAKYFAILPALFGTLYAKGDNIHGPLAALNIIGLHSPFSAVLSATIFNALVIVFLIPLALRGVAYRPQSAQDLLKRNLLIYGLGGCGVPFIGIKLIDVIIVFFNWV